MINENSPFAIMSPQRRERFFKILDTYGNLNSDFGKITPDLYFLNEHFPPQLLDLALDWLIKNRITGNNFISWAKINCGGSQLEMHRVLLMVVQNSKELMPVIAGRNFIS